MALDRILFMGTYRVDFAGALHHVFQRGNDKQAIFFDDDDQAFFLGYLNALKRDCGFKLYAFCLMTNHFHLLLETGRVALSEVMQRLETAYVMRFNEKHARVGHLYQGRYQAKLCARDGYFLRLLRYIHRNPVKAGMVRSCGDYRWSGHRDLASARAGILDVEFPLSFFGTDPDQGRAAYEAYAEDTVDDGWTPSLRDEQALAAVEELAVLLRLVADGHGLSPAVLASGSRLRSLTPAKCEFTARGMEAGFTQAEVAQALRCTSAAIAYLRRKQLKD